jgi:ribonuclease Z
MPGDALTRVNAGSFSIRGVSVGGVYTSLWIPELDAVLDAGIALRSSAGAKHLFLSHAHADHVGALVALLGIRGLHKLPLLRVFLPAEVAPELEQVLGVMSELQRFDLAIEALPMKPGSEHRLRQDLWVRAFRTHHPVPSLGYQFFRRVEKLKPEFLELPGAEIQRRRQAGEALFYTVEHLELAYATDTLVKVLDNHPELFESKVLILECSFLDQKKTLQDSQAGCHIHLDELLQRADRFHNETLVLMHFSQLYSPSEVHQLLKQRCPKALFDKLVVFAPESGPWPG